MFQGQKTVSVSQKKEMCWKVGNARQSNHTCTLYYQVIKIDLHQYILEMQISLLHKEPL